MRARALVAAATMRTRAAKNKRRVYKLAICRRMHVGGGSNAPITRSVADRIKGISINDGGGGGGSGGEGGALDDLPSSGLVYRDGISL